MSSISQQTDTNEIIGCIHFIDICVALISVSLYGFTDKNQIETKERQGRA